MTKTKRLDTLQTAYYNGAAFVNNELNYNEKYLDSLLNEGLLQNKHITRKNNIAYWITQKGINELRTLETKYKNSMRGISA